MKDSIKRIIFISLFVINYALASDDVHIERGDIVHGKPLHEYANSWWQWAVSMSDEDSPIKDRVGVNCGVNQEGPVWYLAGGYGSSRINRKCEIPFGKNIFFPVINMLYFPNGENENSTCASVKEGAALNNQYLRSFKVTVDNQEYINPVYYRLSSKECFDLIAKKPKKYDPETVYPSATDGYWVMLKPLSVGKHRISFRAQYDKQGSSYGTMIQDIDYLIEVSEP